MYSLEMKRVLVKLSWSSIFYLSNDETDQSSSVGTLGLVLLVILLEYFIVSIWCFIEFISSTVIFYSLIYYEKASFTIPLIVTSVTFTYKAFICYSTSISSSFPHNSSISSYSVSNSRGLNYVNVSFLGISNLIII